MNPSQNPSSIRSKKEITNALLCLMQTYPYKDITVKQIILESQVARKTFYRNFLSKDDVLDAYIDTVLQQYIQSLLQLSDCQLTNILDIIFEFCTEHQELFFQLRDNDLMYLFLKKLNVFIPMIHNQVIDANHPMFHGFSTEQVAYIISFNVGAVWNIILEWIKHGMTDSPDMIKTTILEYITTLSSFI